MRLIALSVAMFLAACAAMPDEWDDYPTMPPLPAVVMRVSAQEVSERCQNSRAMGCAIRDEQHGVCLAYVDVKPLPGTIPHELLHCAGFSPRKHP